MLSDFLFLKCFQLNVPEKEKKGFYGLTVNIIAEFHQKNPDWKKIRDLEEKQWPVLQLLDIASNPFYSNSIASKKDVSDFKNLLIDEKKARRYLKNGQLLEKELDLIIHRRMRFLEMMLEITEKDIEDFRKSHKKWWLALLGIGVVTVMGCLYRGAVKLAKNHKKGDEK